jgi:ABC-type dipeptide/oligopeptide/nickel transport system permease subunit
MTENFSYKKQIWQRLKKNKLAFGGLVIIILSFFIAVFSYFLAPDDSPNADLQTVEIQAKKPGYSQLFLKLPDAKKVNDNFLHKLMFGISPRFKYLPISGYKIEGGNIFVNKYVDEDTSILQRYNINYLTNNQPQQIQQNIVTKKYWLGTDAFGRDILSRLIIGTRVSLAVGLIAVFISLTLGILLGSLAGYYRGWVDEVIMWLVNVTWSIPTLLLVFAITLALGKGFWQIFIAVGLTLWVSVARLVRGQVLALKEMEYVQAARALGFRDGRIILKHILPNILGPLMVIAAGNFATAIIIEAGLSFLGIGVQPPQPSWGLMIKENYNFIITHNPMLALVPGIAIMILVLAFNLLGNGFRDAVDVKGD